MVGVRKVDCFITEALIKKIKVVRAEIKQCDSPLQISRYVISALYRCLPVKFDALVSVNVSKFSQLPDILMN